MSSHRQPGEVTADSLTGRAAPSTAAAQVLSIPQGEFLAILEEVVGDAYQGPDGSPQNRWLRVHYKRQQLYVAAAYVKSGAAPRLLRAAWIPESRHCPQMLSRDGICQLLDALVDQGLNAVFPAVWNRGYTAFPSHTMAQLGLPVQDPSYTEVGAFDPVAIIAGEAKQRHLLVVPWLEYGFCSPQSSVAGNHLSALRPEWCSQDKYGNIVQDDYVLWLNSLLPEVQDLLLNLALELLRSYDLPGIQGDDHWPAMHKHAGHDPFTKQAYRHFSGEDPPDDSNDEGWLNWRVDQITNYLSRISQEVKCLKPHALICMGSSLFDYGRRLLMQDGESWIRQGLVDLFHPQIYRDSAAAYADELAKAIQQWPAHWRCRLAPGIHLKPNHDWLAAQELIQMLHVNRQWGLAGEVFFTGSLLQQMPSDSLTALQCDADYQVSAQLPTNLSAVVT